jgi:hypothetical protein
MTSWKAWEPQPFLVCSSWQRWLVALLPDEPLLLSYWSMIEKETKRGKLKEEDGNGEEEKEERNSFDESVVVLKVSLSGQEEALSFIQVVVNLQARMKQIGNKNSDHV